MSTIPGYIDMKDFSEEVGLPYSTVRGHMRQGFCLWPLRTAGVRSCNNKLYSRWKRMNQRCYNPKCPDYLFYGARGIEVYALWRERFEEYAEYIALLSRPQGADTIDRIDNNGNYEPGNLRWATRKDQANNRRPYPKNRKSVRRTRDD